MILPILGKRSFNRMMLPIIGKRSFKRMMLARTQDNYHLSASESSFKTKSAITYNAHDSVLLSENRNK